MANLINRRNFVKTAVGSLAAIPVVRAFADGEMPMLSVDDPQAKALGYAEDTTTVDGEKYATHTAEQNCMNCAVYQGAADSEAGGCGIFPGKKVTANGWCVAWSAKPA